MALRGPKTGTIAETCSCILRRRSASPYIYPGLQQGLQQGLKAAAANCELIKPQGMILQPASKGPFPIGA